MAPRKSNVGTKSDFALRASVPLGQKLPASEVNDIVAAINANYERLMFDWTADIMDGFQLIAGMYVFFSGAGYRIKTSYNVGVPKTWNGDNAEPLFPATSASPIQVFDDITDLLANTGISEGSFAFVTDASDHILNGWGLYQYLSGSRSSISSYQLIAYNVDITKQFTLSWYSNQIDNSAGESPDETAVDRDIFAHFPTNFPINGYHVIALVKLKALGIQSPDEGNGYYAAEKFYTFYRTYAPEVTLKGSNAPYVDPDDDGAKAELSVSDDDTKVRLTLTTPAGDTYAWNVIAEITYSNIYYEV